MAAGRKLETHKLIILMICSKYNCLNYQLYDIELVIESS
jgi:hypothetical protein